jgi:hypothetical protein
VAEGPRAARLPVRDCQWPLQCASAPLSRRPGPAGTVSEACCGAGPRLSEACSHGHGPEGSAQLEATRFKVGSIDSRLKSHRWLASHSSLCRSHSVRLKCGKGNVDRRGAARSSIQRKACCNDNESIHALSSHEWVGTKRSQARECKRTAYTTRMRRHAWCVMTTNANPRLRRHVLANYSMLCSSWQTAARCKPHLDISFAHCRGI